MTIDVRRDGNVAVVPLNRPERKNAITMALCGEIQGAFQDLQANDEVPANILTGAGGDFAACADVGEMAPAACAGI